MSGGSAISHHDAVQSFNAHEARSDGATIVTSLMAGLDTLADLMIDRVAIEPGTMFGVDSMIMPASFVERHAVAKLEIELFQAALATETAAHHGYLRTDDHWFPRWLIGTRLPERYTEPAVIARLTVYRAQPPDTRRLTLETALERALPQAAHAPLVLFRLFPLAVEIATAIAFGAVADAETARKRQRDALPNLADCTACRGALLENGDECRQCGNPLWKYDWLTAE